MIPANYNYKTREDWLRAAVEKINEKIFNNDIDLIEYQISPALLGSKTMGNTVMPYQGEDVALDDFFPPTIHIDERTKEESTIIGVIAHEMIHAFYDVKKHGKAFAKYAKPAGFEKPYSKLNMGEDLSAKCHEIAKELGPYPGVPIKPAKNAKKPKTFSGVIFCPECGYELRVSEKAFKAHGLPTCPCGAKMALVVDEPEEKDAEGSDEM